AASCRNDCGSGRSDRGGYDGTSPGRRLRRSHALRTPGGIAIHMVALRVAPPSRRRSLVVALCTLLCGCAQQPMIQYVPQRVEVRVTEKPPAIAMPPVPRLAIQELRTESNDAEMMAAWVASVQQLKADDQRLRALLEPYATQSQPAGAP